jgi:hypothetical protein
MINHHSPNRQRFGLYFSKTMKAILINPTEKTVTDFELAKGLKAMYTAIDCQCVTRVVLNNKDDLWLDDEGLLQAPQPPKFKFVGSDTVFTGNGLICGYNGEGETISTNLRAEQIRPFIQFVGQFDIEPFFTVTSY